MPQAQRYCRGDFWTWDPKLTTPPGLYLFAAPLGIVWNIIFGSLGSDGRSGNDARGLLCSIPALRIWNVIFALGIFKTIHSLVVHLQSQRLSAVRADSPSAIPPEERASALWEALSICLFPVSFFFHFLYYTDSGSTLFVLLAYLWMLQRRHYLSAIVRFPRLPRFWLVC